MTTKTLNEIRKEVSQVKVAAVTTGEDAMESCLDAGATLATFQASLHSTVVYKTSDPLFEAMYLGLGISDEAGEVSGKIKKAARGDYPMFGDTAEEHKHREAVAMELGDTLWYLTKMANLLGYSLEEIMVMNMAKLRDRQERNQIHGDGDNR